MQNIEELYAVVKEHFDRGAHIAHGMDHVTRVARLARHIAEKEGYHDPQEAEVAGLLHDIGRTVQEEEKGHGPAGVPLAGELLDKYTTYDDESKQRILDAIRDHSAFQADGDLTHIVQDADKLDGLGAVGLMRAYTSKAQLPAYDASNIVPTKGERDTNIHDQIAFQLEWLDMMVTETGRAISQKRGLTMKNFLQTFADEVEGKDFN